MKAEDIKDRETLRAWLRERPRQDAVVIAHRAAMRVLPLWGAEMGTDWAGKRALTALPVLRCGLIMAVAVTLPTADINAADAAAAATTTREAASRVDPSDATSASARAAAAAARAAVASAAEATSAAAFPGAAADIAARAAAATAAAARVATSASVRAATTIYAPVREDALKSETEGDPVRLPLWTGDVPAWFEDAEQAMLAHWDKEPAARWAFWRRWWEGAKTGNPIDPQLQLAIVQGIDEEDWKDPDTVAARIVEIERGFRGEPVDVDQALLDLPPAPTSVVATVQQAIVQHREALPATFETVLGYISLEVERLQSRNYRDDDDAAEAQRQIRVLTTIHDAVQRLSALVPEGPVMPEVQAVEAEKLSRLIYRRICDWPRAKPGVFEDNAADLVDSAYRAALVGGFAYLAPMIGAAPDKALIAGAVVFGGKKILDTAKAAKDAFSADK